MPDNFDSHKWFKKQYLEEANINENWLGQEQIERFEGTVNMRDLKTLQDMLRIVGSEWMQEGFEKEDIKEYVNYYIDQI
jgi:predicted DNA-binding ArsR family transcriptional regulator